LGLSSVNTPSYTGSLGFLLSKPHPVLRLENDAREARENFSAKGAITGRQIVVPHFGFASG
jgi:hypothetical protein